jgi:conjugal transfer pilus assembly protein TraF
MRYLFIILILINWVAYALIEDGFFQDKTSGWFWYKDPVLAKSKKLSRTLMDPAAQVDFEKEELDRVLKIAIKEPTEKNLINFIKLRNKILDQSYNFSLRLQQVNLMNPELDQLKTYPTNQVAKEIYKEQKTTKVKAKIARLSQTYGLFYIFKSNCAYCHTFAPTVKNFATKYNWSLIPITLDGKAIDEFPMARADNGMVSKLQISAVPALIMVEPKANKVFPIVIGAISEEEIIERIDLLTREFRS